MGPQHIAAENTISHCDESIHIAALQWGRSTSLRKTARA